MDTIFGKIITHPGIQYRQQQAVACIYTNRVRGCTTHPTCGRHKL
ncbi:hypothetical protein [Neisseria sicca]|nr:hypothetical protein [Neisseria sicca]